MNDTNFTLTFSVDQTPDQVFAAITNVAGWWSRELVGSSKKAGDVFTYRHKDLHASTQQVIEAIPGKKVVWEVLEAELSFVKDKHEWKGTKISFEIGSKGKKTEVQFTHFGLSKSCECFNACSEGWSFYIMESLQPLIARGVGKPD
jgi:hypothetical protein